MKSVVCLVLGGALVLSVSCASGDCEKNGDCDQGEQCFVVDGAGSCAVPEQPERSPLSLLHVPFAAHVGVPIEIEIESDKALDACALLLNGEDAGPLAIVDDRAAVVLDDIGPQRISVACGDDVSPERVIDSWLLSDLAITPQSPAAVIAPAAPTATWTVFGAEEDDVVCTFRIEPTDGGGVVSFETHGQGPLETVTESSVVTTASCVHRLAPDVQVTGFNTVFVDVIPAKPSVRPAFAFAGGELFLRLDVSAAGAVACAVAVDGEPITGARVLAGAPVQLFIPTAQIAAPLTELAATCANAAGAASEPADVLRIFTADDEAFSGDEEILDAEVLLGTLLLTGASGSQRFDNLRLAEQVFVDCGLSEEMSEVAFPALEVVAKDVVATGCSAETFSLVLGSEAHDVRIFGTLLIQGNEGGFELEAPRLVSAAQIDFSQNPAVVALAFPALSSVELLFLVGQNAQLTSLKLPLLRLAPRFLITGNESLPCEADGESNDPLDFLCALEPMPAPEFSSVSDNLDGCFVDDSDLEATCAAN